jgi:glycosyltransferase involved in cell wall biosynthesis
MQYPISIIMPSFNQGFLIEDSINSIFSQNHLSSELIVMDGGSSDGTIELLESLSIKHGEDNPQSFRWASEEDSGPANAVNKGISLARGSIIGWLNSDDLYTPGSISKAIAMFEQNPRLMMVYGHGENIDVNGNLIGLYPTLPPSTPVEQFANGCFISQPTVFFKKSMWKLLGGLDESLKTAFDLDLWLRAFKAFPDRIGFVDAVQAQTRIHPDTITSRMKDLAKKEGYEVLRKHLGFAPSEWK